MANIPHLDLEKIRRYAAGRVPPEFEDQIRMEVEARGKTVTIVECRPPWPVDTSLEWTREGVARMKYDAESKKWSLYWVDSNDRWHIGNVKSIWPQRDHLIWPHLARSMENLCSRNVQGCRPPGKILSKSP